MNENNPYQNLYHPEQPEAIPMIQEKPEIHYSKTEQISACLAMLAGFLFVRFVFYHTTGLFTTFFYWLLTTFEVIFLKKSGKTFSKSDKLMIAVLYLFSGAYTITANTLMKALTTLFLILDNSLFLLSMTSGLNAVLRFLPEASLLSTLAMSLGEFGKCFGAVKSSKGHGVWKNAGYILGGLLIALPMTCIVAALLCEADENMSALLGNFLKFPPDEILELIPQLLLGIFIGCMIFSGLYSAAHRTIILDEEICAKKAENSRFIPNLMLYAAVTPVCILYVLYFISQINYFTGGFMGVLAEGYTYAEYARKGFFELCAVCCINLAVIAGIGFFAKKTGSEKPLMLKIYSIFLCACSLFLAGTAIAKMFLYIRYYGMTTMRIYTTWFMFLLVIGFIVLIVRQFRHSLNIGKVGYIVFTVMFGLLVFSRPESWITKYNASQYLAGNIEHFDVSVLNRMSLDAWAAVSHHDIGKLLLNGTNAELEARKEGIQDDFYESLNLSAWEIMLNVK